MSPRSHSKAGTRGGDIKVTSSQYPGGRPPKSSRKSGLTVLFYKSANRHFTENIDNKKGGRNGAVRVVLPKSTRRGGGVGGGGVVGDGAVDVTAGRLAGKPRIKNGSKKKFDFLTCAGF